MPEMPDEITFYCGGGAGHPKKRREVVVQSFARSSASRSGWTDLNKSPRLARQMAHLQNGRTLVEDAPFNSQTMDIEDIHGKETRESYSLKCPFCGMTVAMRGEKLYQVLDTLREYGVSRIELGALAATLSTMNG